MPVTDAPSGEGSNYHGSSGLWVARRTCHAQMAHRSDVKLPYVTRAPTPRPGTTIPGRWELSRPYHLVINRFSAPEQTPTLRTFFAVVWFVGLVRARVCMDLWWGGGRLFVGFVFVCSSSPSSSSLCVCVCVCVCGCLFVVDGLFLFLFCCCCFLFCCCCCCCFGGLFVCA